MGRGGGGDRLEARIRFTQWRDAMTRPVETLPDEELAESVRRRQEKLEALRREIQKGIDSGSVGHVPLEKMLADARKRFYGEL